MKPQDQPQKGIQKQPLNSGIRPQRKPPNGQQSQPLKVQKLKRQPLKQPLKQPRNVARVQPPAASQPLKIVQPLMLKRQPQTQPRNKPPDNQSTTANQPPNDGVKAASQSQPLDRRKVSLQICLLIQKFKLRTATGRLSCPNAARLPLVSTGQMAIQIYIHRVK